MIGLLAGSVIGIAATNIVRREQGGQASVWEWTLIGAFLGWQAACWIAMVVAILKVLVSLIPLTRRISATALLTATTCVWLLSWQTIMNASPDLFRFPDTGLFGVALLFAWSAAFRKTAAAPAGFARA